MAAVRPARLLAVACTLLIAGTALAHDVAPSDAAFVKQTAGPAFIPFAYLGAKHMVTGIDHVLFLVGVVFFLFKLRDVLLYVSMFAIGHSITLLAGVLLGTTVNAHIVDAIIGISVIYKGVENLGGFRRLGVTIDPRLAVLGFGLAHGLGLATKLLVLDPSRNGLLVNLIGFNVGVEIGQVLVLVLVVAVLNLWRQSPSFKTGALVANVALVLAGIALTAFQIKEYAAS